jgi:hypothetical protein
MEELVKMLIDQGAIETGDGLEVNAERLLLTQVPPTLTGVLQARLDGCLPPERLTLQQASVIGPVFWDRALLALDTKSHDTLPSLVRASSPCRGPTRSTTTCASTPSSTRSCIR